MAIEGAVAHRAGIAAHCGVVAGRSVVGDAARRNGIQVGGWVREALAVGSGQGKHAGVSSDTIRISNTISTVLTDK